jgi:hypothetical protein
MEKIKYTVDFANGDTFEIEYKLNIKYMEPKKRDMIDSFFISPRFKGVPLKEVPNWDLIEFILNPDPALDYERLYNILYQEAVQELIYRRNKKITIG